MSEPESGVQRTARGRTLAISLLGLLLQLPVCAGAAEFLLPSLILHGPATSDSPFALDSRVSLLYTGESSATVDLHLFNRNSGLPLQSSTGTTVCDPCSFVLTAAAPQQTFIIDRLVLDAGGFATPIYNGYAYVVTGGDVDSLAIQVELLNSHDSSGQVAAHVVPLVPMGSGGGVPQAMTFPLLSATPGNFFTSVGNADARIDFYYTGGTGATAEVFVLEHDGSPFTAGPGACNPCVVDLSAGARYGSILIDNLLPQDGIERELRVDVAVSGDHEFMGMVAFVVRNQGGTFTITFQYILPTPVLQNAATRHVFRDGFEVAWLAAARLARLAATG